MSKRLWTISSAVFLMSLLPTLSNAQTFITAWGSFGGGDGQFLGPKGVAVGGSGDVYVVDDSRVQVFTGDGVFLRSWPCPGKNIAVDAQDNVYVSSDLHIRRFTSAGQLVTEWDCQGETGRPVGCLAVDGLGNVYVSTTDAGDGMVMVYSGDGSPLSYISRGPRYGWLPDGLAADAVGTVFVIVNSTVQKFGPPSPSTHPFVAEWDRGDFNEPVRIAIHPQGNVLVVDHAGSKVWVRTGDGAIISAWGSYGTGPGQFDNPIGIAVDGDGDVYVADTNNSRIQKFGFAPTPVENVTWGSMKARYR